jgi:hypothetical protein
MGEREHQAGFFCEFGVFDAVGKNATKYRRINGSDLRDEFWMLCGDPALYKFNECLRLGDNFLRFGVSSHRGLIVVDDIALASAGIKKIEGGGGGRAKC